MEVLRKLEHVVIPDAAFLYISGPLKVRGWVQQGKWVTWAGLGRAGIDRCNTTYLALDMDSYTALRGTLRVLVPLQKKIGDSWTAPTQVGYILLNVPTQPRINLTPQPAPSRVLQQATAGMTPTAISRWWAPALSPWRRCLCRSNAALPPCRLCSYSQMKRGNGCGSVCSMRRCASRLRVLYIGNDVY